MSAEPKKDEWNLLKEQFNALVQGAGPDGIETIFDTQFRRRLTELISQTAERNGYIDWSRR